MIVVWILQMLMRKWKRNPLPSIVFNGDMLQGSWEVYFLKGPQGWTMHETQEWDVANDGQVCVTVTTQEVPSYSRPVVQTFLGKIKNNQIYFSKRIWIIKELTEHYLILHPPKILFRNGQQQIWKSQVKGKLDDFYLMDRG